MLNSVGQVLALTGDLAGAVKIYKRCLAIAPDCVPILGNLGLSAESLTSFELGYFGAWGPLIDIAPGTVIVDDPRLWRHQFEAGVTGFYNLIDDLVGFQSNPLNPLQVLPVNQDDEEAYGVELEARYVFRESFSTFANYSYVLRRNRETGARSLPRQTVNAGVTYSGRGFNIMLWANYRADSEVDGLPIDSYVLVNGSISYRFPVARGTTGQAFIRFFNLLDDDHQEHPNGDAYGLILTFGLEFRW